MLWDRLFSSVQLICWVFPGYWVGLCCTYPLRRVWLFATPDCSPPGSSIHEYSPGKNTGVGFHAHLQRIFPTQGLNPGFLHCRWILYHLNHQGSPRILEWVAYPFSRGSSWPRNWTGVSCIADGFFLPTDLPGKPTWWEGGCNNLSSWTLPPRTFQSSSQDRCVHDRLGQSHTKLYVQSCWKSKEIIWLTVT